MSGEYAKLSYRSCCYGESEKGPYVYHAEAYGISPALRPTKNTEGKEFQNFSFMAAIDRNPYGLISEECEAKHPNAKGIVPIILTLRDAQKLKGYNLSGRKFAFCGAPQLFHNANGDQIVVNADNIYPISCYKGEGMGMDSRISHSNYVFQKNDGTRGIAYTVTLLNCKVISVGRLDKQYGTARLEFITELAIPSLKAEAISNETYLPGMIFPDDNRVKFTVKGKKAEDMEKILIPGNILLITGRLFATPDDEVSVGGVVREVSIAKWGTPKG